MYISKSRFINWTRCPMYFAMELKHNPTGKADIDAEREMREARVLEMREEMGLGAEEAEEEFDASPSPEFEALLPFYNKVEDEALKVAKKYFHGDFIADYRDVHDQKLFEYEHNGHILRCYVDIYNENDDEINIIEVKATTGKKFTDLQFSDVPPRKRGGNKHPLFVKNGNVWNLNVAKSHVSEGAEINFNKKKGTLLKRYSVEGKYPFDVAFQKFVIERALKQLGDKRQVNFYLAVLNNEYVYDGMQDAEGNRVYNEIDGQEIVTFFNMNEVAEAYQPIILSELAKLYNYIKTPHNRTSATPVGEWCAWGKNTECIFLSHCYKTLRNVPDKNKANNYLAFHGFKLGDIKDKYQLINERYYKFDDIPADWLEKENHKIQRDCYSKDVEWVDKEKMQAWFNHLEYPIYHFDFETFPCPLPRFRGETPYRQSCFEFSLHIENEPGVCDKEKDNIIFLNADNDTDERKALVKAIVKSFKFNEDGNLKGTMLAQNTSFEIGRLKELATLFPEHKAKLMAICNKSEDLIHLLRTDNSNKQTEKEGLYEQCGFAPERCSTINYYHKDLSGSYSIKKTLPVLVPMLTYAGMDVGNGVQAYITYLNYDSKEPTFGVMCNKKQRRDALKRYCQQDTWAMVEILRAVRKKI